jgi:hypothetical protein
VQALTGVSFDLLEGEIHALVGEMEQTRALILDKSNIDQFDF